MLRINILKRITSTDFFIPELDGLRFIAILFVLICHLSGNFFEYYALGNKYTLIQTILERGANGVRIFFGISGFILMKNALKKENFNIKKYYLRRLIRIEPPYLVSLLFYYLVLYHRDLLSLLPNFLISIPYLHSFVYGKPSIINTVTWSLEVEIQFYILFPVFFNIIKYFENNFKLGSFIIISLVFLSILYNYFFLANIRTILDNAEFFFIGILCSWILYKKNVIRQNYNPTLVSWTLVVLTILLLCIESRSNNLFLQILYCSLLFIFFYLIFSYESKFLYFLKNRFISITGGMCYTIYLYHIIILLLFQKFFFKYYINNFYALIIGTVIYLIFLWFFSAILYLFFEKPFMKNLSFHFTKNK